MKALKLYTMGYYRLDKKRGGKLLYRYNDWRVSRWERTDKPQGFYECNKSVNVIAVVAENPVVARNLARELSLSQMGFTKCW